MATDDNAPGIPVSSWTLATGTKPVDRCVFPARPQIQVRRAGQVAGS
jgi:hypothetical protein